MNIGKKIKKMISSITAVAVIMTTASAVPVSEVSAAGECIVDTTKSYQVIDGFGGINHPEWIGDLTDAQVQKAFGNGKDELGLSILRVYVNDDSSQWSKSVNVAKKAQKLGATVFATPWNPPASMRINGNGTLTGGKYQLDDSKFAEYAKHLNSYVKYMEGQGVDLYSISVQNEPDYAEEWTYWTTEELTRFAAQYGKDVIAGTKAKLMSPESFQYKKDIYNSILNNKTAFNNIGVFGTHFYGTPRSWMDFPALENCGKPIWMTEVYVPNSDANSADRWPEALQVSENIHNGLVVGNMSAYVWWYIRRGYSPMKEDGNISKRGYCMAQYSKFVRPGDVRIDVTEQPAENVYVSAYKNNKNQVTIVAVNKGTEGYSQKFTIGSGEGINDVDRYRTSANENLALTENLEITDNGFWAQLPASSVSTFVVTLEGGAVEKPVEPNKYGWYFQDTFEGDMSDWIARGETKIGLSGRTAYVDAESLGVYERTSAWHGAGKPLSEKVFKPGTEYSFSVNVSYVEGEETDNFALKLQYVDANGKTQYKTIAQGVGVKGKWLQLANKNYKIPEDASDMLLYVETAESTSNFYIDEAIGAVAGVSIVGAGEPEIPTEPVVTTVTTAKVTTTTTKATTTTTKITTTTKATTTPKVTTAENKKYKTGDLNADGVINVFDLIIAKRGVLNGFANAASKNAADIDGDGSVSISDVVYIQKFLIGKINSFPEIKNSINPTNYMNNIKLAMSEYAPAGVTDEKTGVEYGTLTKYQYYSTTRERQTNVNVLLPPGYSKNETYPVLYALHGFWENEDALAKMGSVRTMLGNLIAEGKAEKMIVVFPYIYTSKTQESCSGLDLANSLNYDNFINDLKNDLMPYIESNFAVKTGRDNTAITGFSMGGRESLFIGMTLSDKFGFVGAACPAPGLTPGTDLNLHPGQLQENQLKPSGEVPYLTMITAGGNDGVVGNSPASYSSILTTNGLEHIWHSVSTGSHDASSVQPHFYNYLRAIFNN